ncbi:MAG: PH domain-containing protein, partial [Nitriliruptoraceae bacterium]
GATGATDPGAKLPTLLTVPLRHIALAAVTGRQLFVLPAILGASLQLLGGQVGAFFAWTIERIESAVGDSGVIGSGEVTVGLALAVAATGLLAAAIVTAAAVGIVRDGGFTVQRDGDDLVVQRGLLSTRSSSIPLGRVQLVHVARNPLRRLLRVASVRIHSAGGAGGADGRIVVPLMTNARVPSFVGSVLDVDQLPPLAGHPRQARRRAVFRWIRRLVPLAIIVGFITHVRQRFEIPRPSYLQPASLIGWLGDLGTGYAASSLPAVAIAVGVALLATIILGLSEYRLLAHGVGSEVLASRNGTIGSLTVFAPTRRIQAATLRSSWFQRRLHLATVIAHIAGPGGDIHVTNAADCVAMRRHSHLVDDASGSHLKHDRDRTVVDQPNLHVGPEPSGRDLHTGLAKGHDEALDERFSDLRRRGVDE